jgi:hypothetical protein
MDQRVFDTLNVGSYEELLGDLAPPHKSDHFRRRFARMVAQAQLGRDEICQRLEVKLDARRQANPRTQKTLTISDIDAVMADLGFADNPAAHSSPTRQRRRRQSTTSATTESRGGGRLPRSPGPLVEEASSYTHNRCTRSTTRPGLLKSPPPAKQRHIRPRRQRQLSNPRLVKDKEAIFPLDSVHVTAALEAAVLHRR